MKKYGILSEQDYEHYCKALVFYVSISGDSAKFNFSPNRVDELAEKTIYQDLYPMLAKSERLDLAYAKAEVKEFLANSIVLTPRHKEYLKQFSRGNYKPELLFSGKMLENIKAHPMAIWKAMNAGKKYP